MKSGAKTIEGYLKGLPAERREALTAVRKVIRKNLPKGYEETMNWGMISYQVPLKHCPNTYNGQPLCYAALASQKNHMAVYLMSAYGHSETAAWFKVRYKASGKRLDMGKSCVRFRKLDDLPLDLIGETVARVPMDKFIARCEKMRKR